MIAMNAGKTAGTAATGAGTAATTGNMTATIATSVAGSQTVIRPVASSLTRQERERRSPEAGAAFSVSMGVHFPD